jgi:hypothetical protein
LLNCKYLTTKTKLKKERESTMIKLDQKAKETGIVRERCDSQLTPKGLVLQITRLLSTGKTKIDKTLVNKSVLIEIASSVSKCRGNAYDVLKGISKKHAIAKAIHADVKGVKGIARNAQTDFVKRALIQALPENTQVRIKRDLPESGLGLTREAKKSTKKETKKQNKKK